jgi:hypothetical protein
MRAHLQVCDFTSKPAFSASISRKRAVEWEHLMNTYDTFIFDSYSFKPAEGRIEMHYALDDEVRFTETLTIPVSEPQAPSPLLQSALFALHIIGGISYYKTCLPKKIEIRSGSLTPEQAAFWNDVYENGLGEFFYKNNIDFRGLINFPSKAISDKRRAESNDEEANRLPLSVHRHPKKRILVPIGGGKDSVVTAELLRKAGFNITLFRMGQHPLIDSLAHQMDLPLLSIKRSLSPKLFELNEQGALNGHVPVTAYLSTVTILLSLIYNFDAVAMSSERSANEGNIDFHGKEINHQWSKSLDFERAFQNYVKENITPDISYFSALRPLSELHIAKLFCSYPQYFPFTTSCNKNWKILSQSLTSKEGKHMQSHLWCQSCPKCAFVYLLYAAFLDKSQLLEIFKADLFSDESLLPLYRELLGLEGNKPFECVGTPEESAAAFLLAHERGDMEDTAAMKMFLKDGPALKDAKKFLKQAMMPAKDHAIPEEFVSILPK